MTSETVQRMARQSVQLPLATAGLASGESTTSPKASGGRKARAASTCNHSWPDSSKAFCSCVSYRTQQITGLILWTVWHPKKPSGQHSHFWLMSTLEALPRWCHVDEHARQGDYILTPQAHSTNAFLFKFHVRSGSCPCQMQHTHPQLPVSPALLTKQGLCGSLMRVLSHAFHCHCKKSLQILRDPINRVLILQARVLLSSVVVTEQLLLLSVSFFHRPSFGGKPIFS